MHFGQSLIKFFEMIGGWFAMWGGMLFVITMVGACYYTVIYVALPLRNDFDPFFWNCLAFFIIFMICLHLFLFQNFSKYNSVSYWQRQSCVADLCRSPYEIQQTQQVDHVTGVVMKLDSDGKLVKNGKFCIDCNKEAPLRSHHCPLCKMCVIRKDHHCFVTSGCVGLGNQRFFITFLFWVVVGLCIVIRYLGEYMITIDNNFIPWGWTRLFGPFAIIQWMMNYTDLRTAASATLLCFCVASLLGSLGFLGMQLYYTYYGYTMYEYHSAMMRDAFEGDGDNVGERFRLVFGKYWYLNFIVPLVWEMPILTPQIATNLFRVRSKLL